MICPACTGTGMESTDPEDASTCLRCGGSGVVEPEERVVAIREYGFRVEPDEDAYEITDPKHPRHHEVMADYADLD